MLTDILTKAMHRSAFNRLRGKIIGDVMQFIESDLLVSYAYCQALCNRLTT